MYRLWGLGLTSLRIPQCRYSTLNRKNVCFEVSQRAELLQRIPNPFCQACIKLRSTVTNPNPTTQKTRKKRARTNKKFYTCLVVTDTKVTQQKNTVQKLTWSDLKLLATTNLNLSELHKLKDIVKNSRPIEEHTYNNLTIIDSVAEPSLTDLESILTGENETNSDKINNNVITCDIPKDAHKNILPDDPKIITPLEAAAIEQESDILDSIPVITPLQPETIDEPVEEIVEAPENQNVSEDAQVKKLFKFEIANRALASYFEVCSNLKIPEKGLVALNFHLHRAELNRKLKSIDPSKNRRHGDSFQPIRNIKVYNALLRGFAAQGDLQKVEEILGLIRKENISLDLHSYIAIFECLGRINIKDQYLKQIRIYAREALVNGFTFDQILNKGTFLNDQKNLVLAVMKVYDPSFVPTYEQPKVHYDNDLVNVLNHEKQLIEPKHVDFVENGGLFTPDSLKERVEKQLELEKSGSIVIRSIESTGKVSDEVKNYRRMLKDVFRYWEETVLKAFNRDLNSLASQKKAINVLPYLRCIPKKEFVKIVVEEAARIAEGSETYSPTVNQLYRELGNKVYARYMVRRKQETGVLDKILKIHNKYCTHYATHHEKLDVLPSKIDELNARQRWQWAEFSFKPQGATLSMDHREWSPSVLVTIGEFLYSIIIHDVKVDANVMRANSKHKQYTPAFYTIFRVQGRVTTEEVKPHPVLSRLYRASMPETLTFPAYELPMICPPVPWTSVDNGGYLVSPCDVVRLPSQAAAQKQRLKEADPVQLYPSLDALNQLAGVPWRVNTKVLDVILEVFNKGGSTKLDVPKPPSSVPPPPPITPEMDKVQRFEAFRQKLQYKRKKAEMHSLWCDCLYRLSMANHFRDEVFWLPHNMDFRGRVYPIPPHVNHLGSDLARSTLIFAESRPLGPEGLNWLKIHLINLTGLKKRESLRERLRYADEVMEDVLDSADKPLTGRRWWAESEEPWQTLACCMEIAAASRSPDPERYRSHFPIHQDGSCNGLQHYAALGRDKAGAYSVNLCRSEVPQDVYSAVVALVEERRREDAEAGVEVAKALEGFVKRKVIKQTVMTTVYGVTQFGARLQIARQLKDIDNFPREAVWAASSYLTGRTFDSLRSMFTSTKEIQDWFTQCARYISGVAGKHVEWVTPMGLPVVQPYFKYKSMKGGSYGNYKTQVYKPFRMDKYEKPNVLKQKNAFPPNFIHSLDSSHMMLTSLFCERAGITFVSVHDCYWTHPSTVHIMNKICREQFVALHSQPILENLSLFLTENCHGHEPSADVGSIEDLNRKKLSSILIELPETGDFDITQVLKSVYFFS